MVLTGQHLRHFFAPAKIGEQVIHSHTRNELAGRVQ